MKIYDITFTVREPDAPFNIEYSFGHSSGDLFEIIPKFLTDLYDFIFNKMERK